ncbi:MAG: MGMT family protein [Candidatus Cloacimonetes bacterium]|nr:MGMT family protein [Candidatus Cloacimonadota bacterium]
MYDNFTQSVIHIIRKIPAGKVMTYGLVAEIAGNTRAARRVSRILHSISHKENLPWHRVINRFGKISIKDEEGKILQKELLLKEGIVFKENEQIDLGKFLFLSER